MTSINIADLLLKNSPIKHTKVFTILNLICEKVNLIPELKNLCIHGFVELELIYLVCNWVENAYQDGKKHKIDKNSLVIKVLSKLFSISPVEISNVENQTEYLFNNKKIKKLKISKKVFVYLYKQYFFCKLNSNVNSFINLHILNYLIHKFFISYKIIIPLIVVSGVAFVL